MLQMRNADDGKSGWNVNETHIIIPMIDGDLMPNKDSEKILTNTVALNSLEGGDQTILTSGLDHNLVVGLDKNLFETTNYKSDLLIIQNSELKLLPCNTDLKVAYTLSNVEQDKSEFLWQNPCLKDTRICTNDKAIFEVRQVLNYGDVDLEKNNSQINLENIDNDMSQVTKPEKVISVAEKNIEKSPEPQFIINYNQIGDNDKSVSLNNEVSKSIKKRKSIEKKKLYQNDIPSNSNVNSSYSGDFEETIYSARKRVSYGDSCNDKKKSDNVEKAMKKKKETSNECKEIGDKWNDEMSDFFPEKNLPLKKKAKMKRTLTETAETQRSLLNQDLLLAQQCLEFQTRKKIKQIQTGNREEKPNPKIVKNNIKKQNKIKIKIKPTQRSSLVKELKNNTKKTDTDEMTMTKFKSNNETTFSDIFDLVNYLRKIQIINVSIWQILNSGLKEIKVDILKEMITKRREKCSFESCNYSPQLKSFALVLYFKQPAAFNYLLQMFKNGWPTLKIIKEWKRRMNTIHRRNFIREQSEMENDNS